MAEDPRKRSTPPAGMALHAPIPAPAAKPQDEPVPGVSDKTAEQQPAVAAKPQHAPGPVIAGGRVVAAPEQRADTATAAAALSSPIAKRRAAARQLAGELEQEQAAAAEAESLKAAEATVEPKKLIVEPPVAIGARRFRDVHLGQVIAAEVAIIGGLASWQLDMGWRITGIVLAVLLLVLTFGRLGGRWLYQWLGIGTRYGVRRKTATFTPDKSDEAADGVLGVLAHGGAVRRFELDGLPIAVITDATGYTAILEPLVDDRDNPTGGPRDLPALSELAPNFEPGDPPVSLQIVTHVVPAPSLAGADDASANSYRELVEGNVPSRLRTWIAVQVMHAPDAASASDIEATLVNAVRRVERRLRKAGFRPRIRGVRETVEDLQNLLRLDSAAGTPVTAREHWALWHSGSAVHTSYRLTEWPALAHRRGAELIGGIERLPALAVTTSIAVRRSGDLIDTEATLRFASPDAAAAAKFDRALHEVLRGSGADVRAMRGEQAFGVAATIPLGGFAA